MNTVTIISPPVLPLWYPHAALLYLASYFTHKNHQICLIDASIKAYDWFTQPNQLKNFDFSNAQIEQIQKAIDILKGEQFYDFRQLIFAKKTLNEAWQNISMKLDLVKCNLGEYYSKYDPTNINELLEAIHKKEKNMFWQFYNDHLINDIMITSPYVIAISFSTYFQLIPGFILAKICKEKFPDIPIVIGGSLISRIIDGLIKEEKLKDIFDYAIIFEGEITFDKLISNIKLSKNEIIPNVFSWKNNPNSFVEKLNDFQFNINIDYSMTWDNLFDSSPYFLPKQVSPILASRGCYWGKCGFCDIAYSFPGKFRMRDPEKIVQDMNTIFKNDHIKTFKFWDDALPLSFLMPFSDLLIRQNSPYIWECNLRFDKVFLNKKIMRKLFKAGCRALSFGLESGSQRILNLMDKGVDINDVPQILRFAKEAGIFTHIYLITGYPGETIDDLNITKQFLYDNQSFIYSIQVSPFWFTKYSKIYDKITQLQSNQSIKLEEDLSLYYLKNPHLPNERAEELRLFIQNNLGSHISCSKELEGPMKMLYTDFWGLKKLSQKLKI